MAFRFYFHRGFRRGVPEPGFVWPITTPLPCNGDRSRLSGGTAQRRTRGTRRSNTKKAPRERKARTVLCNESKSKTPFWTVSRSRKNPTHAEGLVNTFFENKSKNGNRVPTVGQRKQIILASKALNHLRAINEILQSQLALLVTINFSPVTTVPDLRH
jgi:alpha-L-fucosidase